MMFHANRPVETNAARLKLVEKNGVAGLPGVLVEKKPPLGGFFNRPGQRRLKQKDGGDLFQPVNLPDTAPAAVEHFCCEGRA